MANLHSIFKEFNTKLNITESKEKKLKTARKALTDKITAFFKEKEGYSTPKFWTQGSFQMGTTIRTESDECDLDLGIYFSMIPDVSGETIQKHVFDLVDGHTKNVTPNHKKRCIRVNYAGDFHIDLPIYFFEEGMSHPLLAVKGQDFEESDPKEFYEWFNEQCKGFPQKRRLIRYLKAWADKHKRKMPSGLAMTVFAIQHYSADDRDDIALLNTLKNIKSYVSITWSCILPACPNDDVLARLNNDQKSNFIEALDELISKMEEVTSPNCEEEVAKDICYKVFGQNFPLSSKSKRLVEKAILMSQGGHYTSRQGQITPEDTNVKNKDHKFYGE
ncbi:MAG: hypothetical protein H6598_09560 [Flavobacteriales bacterium]|nr:hypothetical protein [Flavobacteriales bacterium]